MSDPEPRTAIENLEEAAAELIVLLREVGEGAWADWIERDTEMIQRGNRQGLDHLVVAFGGMGSLSDLLIHPLNGHRIDDSEIESVNDRLIGLRRRIAETARIIQRELDG
jgi:hypothetical protein